MFAYSEICADILAVGSGTDMPYISTHHVVATFFKKPKAPSFEIGLG